MTFELPDLRSKGGRKPGFKQEKTKPRNPIVLALEWKKEIESGQHASQKELAKAKGLTPARVNQYFRILKLTPEVVELVLKLGDPLPRTMISEKILRRIVALPAHAQFGELNERMHKTKPLKTQSG